MKSVQLTEAQWQEQVLGMARLFGWRCAHFRPALTAKGYRTPVQADGAGFPDLVLARQRPGQYGELLFVELKSDSGRLSPRQHAWIELLDHVDGVEVYVWRPEDADEVEAVLRG